MYIFVGFVVGVGFSAVVLLGGGEDLEGMAVVIAIGLIVIFPILYAVAGFIGGIIFAFIYNVVSGIIGGIELEVD